MDAGSLWHRSAFSLLVLELFEQSTSDSIVVVGICVVSHTAARSKLMGFHSALTSARL